MRTVY